MSKKKKDDGQQELKNQLKEKKDKGSGKGKTVYQLIDKMKPEIRRALPEHINSDRFTRIALTAIRTTPELQKASGISFIAALMQAAQLGLEPNTPLGQCYIIPRRRKGNWEAQFQMGYKGYVSLAWQSGMVAELEYDKICENDEFEFAKGQDGVFRHKPNLDGDRGKPYAYYAYIKTKSGGFISVVMSKDQILKRAKEHSDSYSSKYSPWKKHFDAMAYKTCLKELIDKKAPKSSDRRLLETAVTADYSVKKDVDENMDEVPDDGFVDITPDEEDQEEDEE